VASLALAASEHRRGNTQFGTHTLVSIDERLRKCRDELLALCADVGESSVNGCLNLA
jgi:hypothetical protein